MRELPRLDKQRVNAGQFASLAAAIASLPSGGGIVWIPNGTYTLASALSLSPGVELEGESRKGVTINAATANAAVKVTTPAGTNNNAICLRRLTFADTGTTPYGLDLRGMTEVIVEDVETQNFETAGVYLGGDGTSYGNAHTNTIRHLEVRGSPTSVLVRGTTTGVAAAQPTGVNILLDSCRLFPKDVAGAIGLDLYDAEHVQARFCDIGYAANATGVRFRANARSCSLLFSRFEAIATAGGLYPVQIDSGATFPFLFGNDYGTSTDLKVSDADPANSRAAILDVRHRDPDWSNAFTWDVAIPVIFRLSNRFETGATNNIIESRDTAESFKNFAVRVDGKLVYYDPTDGTTVQASIQQASSTVMQVTGNWQATGWLEPQAQGSRIYAGAGTPEGAVAAAKGSLFLRTDGGAGTSLYVKESGASTTGWAAK